MRDDKTAEALTRILEHESWARFKAAMSLQQGLGEETCDVLPFANIDADVEGFVLSSGTAVRCGAAALASPWPLSCGGSQPSGDRWFLTITPQVYSTAARRQGQGLCRPLHCVPRAP